MPCYARGPFQVQNQYALAQQHPGTPHNEGNLLVAALLHTMNEATHGSNTLIGPAQHNRHIKALQYGVHTLEDITAQVTRLLQLHARHNTSPQPAPRGRKGAQKAHPAMAVSKCTFSQTTRRNARVTCYGMTMLTQYVHEHHPGTEISLHQAATQNGCENGFGQVRVEGGSSHAIGGSMYESIVQKKRNNAYTSTVTAEGFHYDKFDQDNPDIASIDIRRKKVNIFNH